MARKKDSKLAGAARTLGAAGASKGGHARAKVLTKAQRTEIARKGGKERQRTRSK